MLGFRQLRLFVRKAFHVGRQKLRVDFFRIAHAADIADISRRFIQKTEKGILAVVRHLVKLLVAKGLTARTGVLCVKGKVYSQFFRYFFCYFIQLEHGRSSSSRFCRVSFFSYRIRLLYSKTIFFSRAFEKYLSLSWVFDKKVFLFAPFFPFLKEKFFP